MGDYLNALNAYNNAMQIFKGNNSLIQQGSALVGIGRAHSGLGNYLEAIENLQKALEIFENLNESQDLNGHIRLGHKNVLYALSEVHALMGSNEKAREFDLKIRNLSQWNKNNKLGQFLNLINQGQNCEKRSNFEKALKKYQQAFSLSRETSNKQCEAMSLEYIGNIYKELKKYPNAIKYYLDALALDREQKYIIGELSVLKGIAYIYMIQSDFTNALVCYQQALKKAKETGSNIFEIDALGGVGLSSNALKDYKTAEVYYKEALIKSKELDVPGKIWRYNYRLGTLAQVSGHYQEAKCYYSEAIDVIESVREKISLEEYKTSFVENKINVYRNMITVLLLLKEDKEAFNYVERAKSRSFLDLLGNRLNLKRGKDKKLSQVEMQLQKKISKLLEKIRNEQALPKEKQRVVLSIWNEELMKARKRYSEILLEIRREAPELHSLVSVNPLSLKEIQVLIDPDTTLLAYYLYHYTVNGKKDYIVLCWVINKRESFLCSTERVSGLPSKIKILREKM